MIATSQARPNSLIHVLERESFFVTKILPSNRYRATLTNLYSVVLERLRMKDYGGKEGLTLDYQGSLPCLAGRDHALDCVAFDSAMHCTWTAKHSSPVYSIH